MSRYFFDLHNGDGEVADENGVILNSEADVPHEVARILTGIAMEEFTHEDRRGVITVKVRNAEGTSISVGTLTFTYETLDRP
ncbi:DUF6894 family protein [Rhizobium terrae]|uniref:DUF6894 family protein n=1 Tax=Rhizobium terrae TaxID=2171756 RepID=UPI000E3C3172|nr:hypothetical protein [Rhizobium terrae]